MNWIWATSIFFVLWSTYAIPGQYAEKTHGVAVNMMFETLAFIAITLFMSGKIIESLPRVTGVSAVQASCLGLGSALGFYFFLTAMSIAPDSKSIVLIILVAGLTFPMQGVLMSFVGESLSIQQWLAIGGMIASIALYNWKF